MRKATRTPRPVASLLCLLVAAIVSLGTPAIAAPAEHYLHVHVQDPAQDQSVDVNVPLSLAEKILPAIDNHGLHDGKVAVHCPAMNGVNVPDLLAALRTAPDDQFVTVKNRNADVRVAKAHGYIIVHVIDKQNRGQKVDVTVPFKVADALFSTAHDGQLDIASALQALNNGGDVLLVTVQNSGRRVRVWVDSHNSQD